MFPRFDHSPQRYARLGGWLYLLIIVLGLFGEAFVRTTLVVPGDAAATLDAIARAPSLWRAGIAGDLLMQVCDLPVIVILYLLLRPVSRPLALLATGFNLIQTAVLALNKLTLLVPLFLLGDAAYLKAIPVGQLQALSQLAITAHGYGFGIGLIFFGVACLIRGHLMQRSGFFPKPLGLLLQIAGLSYLVNSFALLLSPALAGWLFPAVLLPAFVGELAVCLWLLIKGVDAERWRQRAAGPA